ncbi:unnamed protein product, partial [Mesorhabditis belari]|uniref:F-box domain-containing protein n=1 Tax=Mesorhabditis belari TaxID=2138241 RepID=A0AAF3FIP4_9BILA
MGFFEKLRRRFGRSKESVGESKISFLRFPPEIRLAILRHLHVEENFKLMRVSRYLRNQLIRNGITIDNLSDSCYQIRSFTHENTLTGIDVKILREEDEFASQEADYLLKGIEKNDLIFRKFCRWRNLNLHFCIEEVKLKNEKKIFDEEKFDLRKYLPMIRSICRMKIDADHPKAWKQMKSFQVEVTDICSIYFDQMKIDNVKGEIFELFSQWIIRNLRNCHFFFCNIEIPKIFPILKQTNIERIHCATFETKIFLESIKCILENGIPSENLDGTFKLLIYEKGIREDLYNVRNFYEKAQSLLYYEKQLDGDHECLCEHYNGNENWQPFVRKACFERRISGAQKRIYTLAIVIKRHYIGENVYFYARNLHC